jgi:hypothetical protein
MRISTTIALFVLFLISVKSYSQNLHFKYKYNTSSKSYSLPIKLKCFFADGTTRNLILDSVRGDSMHFRKYYNQPNYDCSIYDLEIIRIYHPLNIVRDVTVISGCGLTLLALVAFSLSSADNPRIIGLVVPMIILPTAILYFTTRNNFDLEAYEVGER